MVASATRHPPQSCAVPIKRSGRAASLPHPTVLDSIMDRGGGLIPSLNLGGMAAGWSTTMATTGPSPAQKLRRSTQAKARRRNGRVITAPEYVQKMNVDADRRPAMRELADRFEAKSFLPMCADISNFCTIYGIDEPASKSRAAAIPRLFKYLATMNVRDIKDLVANNAFSGPSRLGPLAEAIRRRGRAERNLDAKGRDMPAA